MSNIQPILPAPSALVPLEQAYQQDEPPGLFPQNQDSNLGQYRKVFASKLQEVADQQTLLYQERFPNTSIDYLNYWEEQVGIPQVPPGLTIPQRQARVMARLKKGYFTRSLRNSIIESFIIPYLSGSGTPPAFRTSGIPLTAGGIPLYSGITGDPKQYYTVTEFISQFRYQVNIDPRITIDTNALSVELSRITPAGISFTFGVASIKTGGTISRAISGGTKSANLVTNGTFEGGTTGWTSSDGSATLAQSATHVFEGSQALRVTPGAASGSGARTTGQAATAAGHYNSSLFVYAPNGQAMIAQAVRADLATVIASYSWTGNAAFKPASFGFSAPATETIYIFVRSNQASGQPFWVDSVSLWRSS